MSKYTPKTKIELMALVEDETIHLGDIDTSNITDMSGLFKIINRKRTDFSGIEKWDVSKVTNMRYMFAHCYEFNQPLNSWDVSNVEDMNYMFSHCPNFNQDLSSWDVSKVEDMSGMFYGCKITEEQAFSGELKEQSSKPKKQR